MKLQRSTQWMDLGWLVTWTTVLDRLKREDERWMENRGLSETVNLISTVIGIAHLLRFVVSEVKLKPISYKNKIYHRFLFHENIFICIHMCFQVFSNTWHLFLKILNENQNITNQNLWNTVQTMTRVNLILIMCLHQKIWEISS